MNGVVWKLKAHLFLIILLKRCVYFFCSKSRANIVMMHLLFLYKWHNYTVENFFCVWLCVVQNLIMKSIKYLVAREGSKYGIVASSNDINNNIISIKASEPYQKWTNAIKWKRHIRMDTEVYMPYTIYRVQYTAQHRKPVHNLWSLINKHLAAYYLMFVRLFIVRFLCSVVII